MANTTARSRDDGSFASLAEVLTSHRDAVLKRWVDGQSKTVARGVISPTALTAETNEFMNLVIDAMKSGTSSIDDAAWDYVREFLGNISRSRAEQGFSPSETAMFVFSVKEPLFDEIQKNIGADRLGPTMWEASRLLDSLGLFTTEMYQKRREDVIHRQQQDMLELSTPVVMLWDGILALPMIGTLDSSRTQVVMETLLQRIVETGADFAILDITGVPTVDTLTAQHLLKTVTAARLMGAECIISGIRPQIAQTVVHLGVNLGDIVTKATLADAFRVALQRSGRTVTKIGAGQSGNAARGSSER